MNLSRMMKGHLKAYLIHVWIFWPCSVSQVGESDSNNIYIWKCQILFKVWNPISQAGREFSVLFLNVSWKILIWAQMPLRHVRRGKDLDFYITVDQPHKPCVNAYNTTSDLWEFNSITGHNDILGLLSLLLFFLIGSIDYSNRGKLFPRCSEITKQTGPDLFFITQGHNLRTCNHIWFIYLLLICSSGEALKR